MLPALALLEISKLSPPVPEGDVPMLLVLAFAVLNPAVIAIAFAMGRKADQLSKILIAAFAGAVGGVALIWLGAFIHLPLLPVVGRAAAGIFIVSLFVGLAWAFFGYKTRK